MEIFQAICIQFHVFSKTLRVLNIKVFNIVIILSWIVAYKLHVQNEIMYSNEIHFVLEWNVFPSSLS